MIRAIIVFLCFICVGCSHVLHVVDTKGAPIEKAQVWENGSLGKTQAGFSTLSDGTVEVNPDAGVIAYSIRKHGFVTVVVKRGQLHGSRTTVVLKTKVKDGR